MHALSFQDKKNKIIEMFKGDLDFDNDEFLNGQFNIVSAGLSNFLPSINASAHTTIFKEMLLHKEMSTLEQTSYETLDYLTTENLTIETWDLLKSKPNIICTFHTGSYRSINLFLIKNKIPYSLVVAKNVLQKEGINYVKIHRELPFTSVHINDDFRLIDAEAPGAALKMIKELKSGRSLLIYVDGNLGGGKQNTHNENSCCINFLNQKIVARKGFAFLAHSVGVNILPVACYRTAWNDIRLCFYSSIIPNKDMSINSFAEETTKMVYDLVAPIIQKYPEQWEGWLYIHKVAIIATDANNARYCRHKNNLGQIEFNSSQFGIFKMNNTPFLIRKNTYSFFEIDNSLYEFLKQCKSVTVRNVLPTDNRIINLLNHGVLTYR